MRQALIGQYLTQADNIYRRDNYSNRRSELRPHRAAASAHTLFKMNEDGTGGQPTQTKLLHSNTAEELTPVAQRFAQAEQRLSETREQLAQITAQLSYTERRLDQMERPH